MSKKANKAPETNAKEAIQTAMKQNPDKVAALADALGIDLSKLGLGLDVSVLDHVDSEDIESAAHSVDDSDPFAEFDEPAKPRTKKAAKKEQKPTRTETRGAKRAVRIEDAKKEASEMKLVASESGLPPVFDGVQGTDGERPPVKIIAGPVPYVRTNGQITNHLVYTVETQDGNTREMAPYGTALVNWSAKAQILHQFWKSRVWEVSGSSFSSCGGCFDCSLQPTC